MSLTYKCLTCGITVFGDNFGRRFICNTCEQTETIKKQGQLNRETAEQQTRQQQYQFEEQQRQARESLWQQQLNARLDREATVNAMIESARYSAESNQSTEDAYRYGLNYIHDEWANSSNPHGLKIYFDETYQLRFTVDSPPYLIPHLTAAFNKGIRETLSQWTGPTEEHFKANIRQAGEQCMNYFCVPWSVPETGYQVNSVSYTVNLSTNIDSVDGEITYTFNDVFESAELNNIYRSGVRQTERNLNSSSNKYERLKIFQDYQKEKNKQQTKEKLRSLAHYLTIEMWPVWVVFLILVWLFS